MTVRDRPARKGTRRLLAVLLSTVALLAVPPVGAASAGTPVENEVLHLLNAERARAGLVPLRLSPAVSEAVSRPLARELAREGELDLTGTAGPDLMTRVDAALAGRATDVGENVGYAADPALLHTALMDSAAHRAIVLDPDYRYLGLGVVQDAGRTWVAQTLFAAAGAVDAEPRIAPPGRTAVDAWVEALYADFLGRAPDSAGLAHWSGLVSSGRMSRQDVARVMASTDEWLNHVVTEQYRDTLGRLPEAGGLATWREQLRAGMPVSELGSRLFASDERFQRYGSTASAWVSGLYAEVLGRFPEAAGRTFWADRTGTAGRLAVAREIVQSPESLALRVEGLYATLLARAADPSGLRTWPAVVRDRGDLELAAFLASSPEYQQQAQRR